MSTHMLLIKGMPTGAYIDVGELRAALAPQMEGGARMTAQQPKAIRLLDGRIVSCEW